MTSVHPVADYEKADNCEAWIASVEAAGEIRILRRLGPARYAPRIEAPRLRVGLCVDVEATGLDTSADEIIELALLPFSYGADHRIVGLHEPFAAFREPTVRFRPSPR